MNKPVIHRPNVVAPVLESVSFSEYFKPEDFSKLPDEIIRAYRNTVRLTNLTSTGTGIILRPGMLLTCKHVIDEFRQVGHSLDEVKIFGTNNDLNLAGSKILFESKELDTVILSCPGLNSSSNVRLVGNPLDYIDGSCYLIGNPVCQLMGKADPGNGIFQLFSMGQVVACTDTFVDLKALTVNPGSSGGPILTPNGELLGIVSEAYGQGGRGILVKKIMEEVIAQSFK